MFEACVDLPCDLTAVALARRFVDQTVRSWELEPDQLDDAILLTSELVANAVLHARTDIRVLVRASSGGSLRIEVADANSRLPAAAAVPEDATSGRGMLVLEQVADHWGVERTDDGKTVWFELGTFGADTPDDCVDLTDVPSVDEALDRIEELAQPPDSTASSPS